MNIAVIGGGYWGKNLIREYYNLQKLHTICDMNILTLKELSDQYPSINTTNDYTTVFNNKEITAVVIATPSHTHYKLCLDALIAGKDVFVEKPITLNSTEATYLIEVARHRSLTLMTGHILQYHPAIRVLKKLIDKGEIGEMKYIVSNRYNLGKFRTEENVVWSFAPHDISVILSLLGSMPDRVMCSGKAVLSPNIHDITNTVMYFGDVYVNINVNWLNPFKEQKMTIVGDKGMIVFDDTIENKVVMYKDYIKWDDDSPSANRNAAITVPIEDKRSPLLCECEHFIECCEKRIIPLTDGNEGLRTLRVLEMLTDSLLNTKSLDTNRKYFAHETAVIDEGADIGDKTKIWHFTHISGTAKIGVNCNIGQNVYVGENVVIGNNCKIQNNVSVYTGVTVEDDVFLGPSCVFTNDKTPRANKSKNGKYMTTVVKRGATIGANATILCGLKIGCNAMIGAGSVVTKDVSANTVVKGKV